MVTARCAAVVSAERAAPGVANKVARRTAFFAESSRQRFGGPDDAVVEIGAAGCIKSQRPKFFFDLLGDDIGLLDQRAGHVEQVIPRRRGPSACSFPACSYPARGRSRDSAHREHFAVVYPFSIFLFCYAEVLWQFCHLSFGYPHFLWTSLLTTTAMPIISRGGPGRLIFKQHKPPFVRFLLPFHLKTLRIVFCLSRTLYSICE